MPARIVRMKHCQRAIDACKGRQTKFGLLLAKARCDAEIKATREGQAYNPSKALMLQMLFSKHGPQVDTPE